MIAVPEEATDLATRRGAVVAELRASGADPGLVIELDHLLEDYARRLSAAEDAEALGSILGRVVSALERSAPHLDGIATAQERSSKALALLANQPKLMIGVAVVVVAVVALAFGANVETLSVAVANILHGVQPCPPL